MLLAVAEDADNGQAHGVAEGAEDVFDADLITVGVVGDHCPTVPRQYDHPLGVRPSLTGAPAHGWISFPRLLTVRLYVSM
ncbi:hypothetical protein GCM10010345_04990 [Streptomyces canarius]|uniref:Uncharacterized protein n=1 Tax=Streptomyces canarius TaxID=285453 RepID=A0ABQ3CDH2_9ACTN|nr:hypothetical protein GCM10010345_04990 [Streptomyces canarius]